MQTETALEASSGVSKGFLLDYGHVVALSILWGLAFVAIRRAEYELAPQNLTILRCLIASAGFITFAPAYGKPRKPLQRKDIPRLLIVSLASVVGHHLSLNYAETIVSSGLAGLLISFGGWLSVGYLAIISTIVANMILYTLIGSRAVSKLSIQLYLIPVVSLVGGFLLLGETLSVFTVIGACFLLARAGLATRKH